MSYVPKFAPLLFVVLVGAPAQGQPAPRVKATKEANTSPYAVAVRAGTGLGVFQDIQVPANESAQMRGDGKLGAEENADHAGIPLYVGIGLNYKADALKFDLVRLDALQMRATTGPSETQSSSYSRLEVGTAATYTLPVGAAWAVDFGVKAGARRSSFSNVSSAHYIEALVAGGSLALVSESFRLEAFAAAAPVARFGYTEESFLGGKAFSKSKASLAEGGVTAAFKIGPRVHLEAGLEQESANVTLDDVSEYNNFGLSVEDSRRPSRIYDLATSVLRVGVRKEF